MSDLHSINSLSRHILTRHKALAPLFQGAIDFILGLSVPLFWNDGTRRYILMSSFKNPYESMNELVESLVKENEELKQVITLSPNITFPVNFIRELASGFC